MVPAPAVETPNMVRHRDECDACMLCLLRVALSLNGKESCTFGLFLYSGFTRVIGVEMKGSTVLFIIFLASFYGCGASNPSPSATSESVKSHSGSSSETTPDRDEVDAVLRSFATEIANYYSQEQMFLKRTPWHEITLGTPNGMAVPFQDYTFPGGTRFQDEYGETRTTTGPKFREQVDLRFSGITVPSGWTVHYKASGKDTSSRAELTLLQSVSRSPIAMLQIAVDPATNEVVQGEVVFISVAKTGESQE